jgi:REP element-mobilizing transposase RayT
VPRRHRIYFQNAVYHITIRGNNRQRILEWNDDKELFLKSLQKFKSRFAFKLFGFVLMDNHVHLVIRTNSKVNISKIMHAIELSYSVKFRKKYAYSGYVWQGRFKSNVIDDENYILECINYIHNNPVRAGMVERIEDYPWSSYHFYNGLESRMGNHIGVDRFSED